MPSSRTLYRAPSAFRSSRHHTARTRREVVWVDVGTVLLGADGKQLVFFERDQRDERGGEHDCDQQLVEKRVAGRKLEGRRRFVRAGLVGFVRRPRKVERLAIASRQRPLRRRRVWVASFSS